MTSGRRQTLRLAIALLIGSGISSSVLAQSGRRSPKNVEKTPITPEVSSPIAPVQPAQPKNQLFVARQGTQKHLPTEDVAFASFLQRLNEYADISATSIGDLKHSQAIKRAKHETQIPVVVLSFDIDRYAGGTIILNSQDLEIEYFLFAPQTGKKQTQGKVYFQGVGSGRLRKSDWPNGTPVKMTPEAAGIDAAEALHQWLMLDAARRKAR